MNLRDVQQGGAAALRALGAPLREDGVEIAMLWSATHYDGPRTGVCLYRGRKHWFADVSNGWGDIVAYLVVEVSEEDLRDEERRHDLFVRLVGTHTDYRYENGRRVRGEQLPETRWADYCEAMREIRHDFREREVVAWWCDPGLDVEAALAERPEREEDTDEGSKRR